MKTRGAVRALSAIGVVLLAACGGDGGDQPALPPATAPVSAPGVATIGSSGGLVRSDDGAEVSFPPGALTAATTIRVARDGTGAPPLPPAAAAAGAIYAITPHGGAFDTHVEVAIPIEPRAFAADEQLVLLTASPGDAGWTLLSNASFASGKLRAPVMKFSFFRAVVLRGVVVPQLVTSVDDMNNLGIDGARQIAPDQVMEPRPTSFSSGGWDATFVARLRFPAGRLSAAGENGLPPRACLPANLDSSGAAFRFMRDGEIRSPVVRSVRLPYTAVDYPRFENEFSWSGRSLNLNRMSAYHFYGQDTPRVGGFGSEGTAQPPANNRIDDDLLTWRGVVPLTSADNGRVRVDVTIPTDCGLFIEAAPLAFRLNLLPASGFVGYQPLQTVVTGTQGSDQALVFADFAALGSAFRLEYSASLENWQAISIPAQLQPAGSYRGAPTYSVTLANLVPAMAGYYRAYGCDATAPARCVLGYPIELRVQPDQPGFIQQPPAAPAVRAGDRVQLRVAVSTRLKPAVRWQKRNLVLATFGQSGWTDVPAADFTVADLFTGGPGIDSEMRFTAATADHGMQYRAVIESSAWMLTSEPATLSVVETVGAPQILAQPSSLTVATGSTAVFVATVGGTPPFSYQWRRNGVSMAGANTATLTLNNVTNADAGSYTLEVSNSAGSITSAAALLVVGSGTPVAQPPQITAAPASLTVNEGNAASFAVSVSGTGPYTYAWRKNGAPIAGATGASYSIAATTPADAGSYSVRISNAQGSVDSAAATLSVLATPVPPPPVAPTLVTPPVGLAVQPGGGATFAVAVSGTGPFSYQWQRNGVNIAGATGPVLHLPSVSGNDAGQYSVAVMNAAGAVASTPVPLIVIGAPEISQQPTDASVAAGSTASFVVAANGPGLRYQWLRNGVAIAGATGDRYTTPSLALGDSGASYAVIVYNGAGIAFSATATLTVQPAVTAPGFTVQPVNVTVNAGQSAVLQFGLAGSAPFSVQLQRLVSGDFVSVGDPVQIASSGAASVTSPTLQVADSGHAWRVVVSNSAGSMISASVNVFVNDPACTVTVAGTPQAVNGQFCPNGIGTNAVLTINFRTVHRVAWQEVTPDRFEGITVDYDPATGAVYDLSYGLSDRLNLLTYFCSGNCNGAQVNLGLRELVLDSTVVRSGTPSATLTGRLSVPLPPP